MDLRESVIRTVSYFDLFDFPLTRAEVWRWLISPEVESRKSKVTIAETDAAVSNLIAEGKLQEVDGMVFLAGRSELPGVRESRYRHAARKWRRARRWARLFAALPGVELVGIGNTLAFHGARDGSDIDFFIITAPGTIWRTRFFSAGIAQFFGMRPRGSDTRDKLCLSFFVTTDAQDLSKLRITSAEHPNDVYLTYWTAQMVPLAGSHAAYARFRDANRWVEEHLPNAAGRASITAPWPIEAATGLLGFVPGDFMKDTQSKTLPKEIRDAQARADGSVIVTDSILKFHVNDRRAELHERWLARVSAA